MPTYKGTVEITKDPIYYTFTVDADSPEDADEKAHELASIQADSFNEQFAEQPLKFSTDEEKFVEVEAEEESSEDAEE